MRNWLNYKLITRLLKLLNKSFTGSFLSPQFKRYRMVNISRKTKRTVYEYLLNEGVIVIRKVSLPYPQLNHSLGLGTQGTQRYQGTQSPRLDALEVP